MAKYEPEAAHPVAPMTSSANRLLIQVVGRLTPGRCGVSDQAVLLAEELKSAFGIDTAFVVLNSKERSEVPFRTIHGTSSELPAICRGMSERHSGSVLVHLSGYAYSADGAPVLLADGLSALRQNGGFRIAVYFHELFATGMPWKSAFWHSWRQRRAVRKIAEDSDLIVTSTRYYADWLELDTVRQPGAPVIKLPVFSACGEAHEPIPVKCKDAAMVVFGLAGTRQRAYKELASLHAMLSFLGIEEILDIGPECDVAQDLAGIPVRQLGRLPAPEIVSVFGRMRFGYVPYPPFCLAKSSICASYCAHGVIPVISQAFRGDMDGLRDGVQVISPRSAQAAQPGDQQRCSTAAWSWHARHNLRTHASTYCDWIMQAG